MDNLAHMLRRSRMRSLGLGSHHAHLARSDDIIVPDNASNPDLQDEALENALEKKAAFTTITQYSPAQLSSLMDGGAATTAAQESTVENAFPTSSVNRAAAGAAGAGTTIATSNSAVRTSNIAPPETHTSPATTSSITSASSIVAATTATHTISTTSAISKSIISTTSHTSTSSSSTSLDSSTKTVITLTTTTPTSSASATRTASIDAAHASSHTTGLSTGGIVGVVLAVLVGLVVVGSAGGWFYRKCATRGYLIKRPWSKIDEDTDVTPFPNMMEKQDLPSNDIYGGASAPVIGSRRALALARANAFNDDGSVRPDSTYSFQNGSNRAGVGAGNTAQHNTYPQYAQTGRGFDAHGRPYNHQPGRMPSMQRYQDEYADMPPSDSPPSNTRQLVGPAHAYSDPALIPVPMGRPAPPSTEAGLAAAEDFGDVLEPYSADGYTPTGDCFTPQTAVTFGEWAGHAQAPPAQSLMQSSLPKAMSPERVQRPLPALTPLSPLMSAFDLRKRESQPLAMYEDDQARQKRMYGEVAKAAGVAEPVTPRTPGAGLSESTSSHTTSSTGNTSFSASEPMPRLPSAPYSSQPAPMFKAPHSSHPAPKLTVVPPQPYIHGRPLSPLVELPTPLSYAPAAHDSPSIVHTHGQGEVNPFDRIRNQHIPFPPHSAASIRTSAFPSPAYPPPSPGGLSVPGSVSNSPRGWTGPRPGMRPVSILDEEDAYGGI